MRRILSFLNTDDITQYCYFQISLFSKTVKQQVEFFPSVKHDSIIFEDDHLSRIKRQLREARRNGQH